MRYPTRAGAVRGLLLLTLVLVAARPAAAVELQARGAGIVPIALTGEEADFSFQLDVTPSMPPGAVLGTVRLTNRVTGDHVQGEILAIGFFGPNFVNFSGTCTVNGSPGTFGGSALDNGEPGEFDAFSMGYVSPGGAGNVGGTLLSGNVEVNLIAP
jgi:hypothetical protein